jgi:hypothetical protein
MIAGASRPGSVVGEALRGRIGVPDELRRHLRQLEAQVRQQVEALGAVPTTDPDIEFMRSELAAVLDDPRRSPLLKALRRRTEHLREGAPARRSLDQSMDGLLDRAKRVVEGVHARDALRAALERLDTRFGALLPWHLARGLERVRLTPATVERMQDAASLRAAVARAGELETELAERLARLPPAAEPREVAEWPEGVSHAELAAAVVESDRATRVDRGLSWRATGRAQARTHVTRLIGPPNVSGARGDWAEAAAGESLRLVEAGFGTGAEDLDAQLVAVRGAARRRRATSSRASPTEAAVQQMEDSSGGLLFVVPLFGEFVLIRRGEPWPVRIDETGVRCGRPAQCSAVLAPGAVSTPLRSDVWAPLFFDLPAGAEGEWLSTVAPATVLPFARIADDRWLGHVIGRGKLRSAGHSRWSGERPRRGKVIRTLLAASEASAEAVIAVGPVLKRQEGPFGWRTLTVQLPLADVPQGWLRTADSVAGRDHVEAEQAFFQAAGRLIPGSTPRCLGRSESPHGYVYAPPLALSPESSLTLRNWREEDPVAIVAAAARLWRRFTDAGLALGFYHAATLAFRMHSGESGSGGVLEAVAIAAPLGTRLGRMYRRSIGTKDMFPIYHRLGSLPFQPAIVSGSLALPDTEAAALSLYGLDTLACRPVVIESDCDWASLPLAIRESAHSHFANPAAALALQDVVRRGADALSQSEFLTI